MAHHPDFNGIEAAIQDQRNAEYTRIYKRWHETRPKLKEQILRRIEKGARGHEIDFGEGHISSDTWEKIVQLVRGDLPTSMSIKSQPYRNVIDVSW